ncbi:unnamed protein product [Sphagnum jensenii]|uniref:Portal protein n=1 Tax=Sphagnum jensenii TaxID=128206 RepID=A0ABP0VHD1_9BRYO
MHEPSITVSPASNNNVSRETLDLLEGYIRHVFYTANLDGYGLNVLQDTFSGGFSSAKVYPDYANPMSFDYEIFLQKSFDATLVGFDPMARTKHKGDGEFSFEIFPMLEHDFRAKYPDVSISNIGTLRDIEGFNWAYKDMQNRKIFLVADYYEKKTKKQRIVKLANGRVMTTKNYDKLKDYWEREQFIEQLPAVIGKPRNTEIQVIHCYRLIEDQILKSYETDYAYLPHVFVDGNSINLTQGTANTTYQMTRPLVYHAKGVQDLKNFAGQSLANYLENIIQHKFIVMKEAIPQEQDYLEALNDIQRANTIVVNAFVENNPDQPIGNPIREVQNLPAPPEVMGAFQASDPAMQTIVGGFASNLAKGDNDLSGKAIIETISESNATAMPYVNNYLASMTQIARIIVDYFSKYIVGKRSVPIIDKEGNHRYQEINSPGNPLIDYDHTDIKVMIEAGVNFQVQKNRALAQITQLMQASPTFAEFMADDDSLPILVDNLTIYGADRLQDAIPKWIEKKNQMKQQAQQAQQQAMQQNPMMMRAQADVQKTQMQVQIEAQKAQLAQMQLQSEQQQQDIDNQFKIAQLAIDDKLADAKIIESEAKVSQAQIDSAVKLEESNSSLQRHALDSATKLAEIESRRHQDKIAAHKLIHELSKGKRRDEIQTDS